jgi:hypothetical protein
VKQLATRRVWALVGAATLAAAVGYWWLSAPVPTAPASATAPVNATAPPAPPPPQAEAVPLPGPQRSASAAFDSQFKAARAAPRPAPVAEVTKARTFAEAFEAMKRAEAKQAEGAAAANPFGGAR